MAVELERYEEDLTATLPIREEQHRQLEGYVESLEAAAEQGDLYPADFTSASAFDASLSPLRDLLRRRIGYPPPSMASQADAADSRRTRFDHVAEDAVADYYRCFVAVTDFGAGVMEAYGLLLIPKHAKVSLPLVIAKHGGGGTPETATFHGGANYRDMVRGAVNRGYAVFAPLTIFNAFCDKDRETGFPVKIRARLDRRLRLLGTSLTAVEIAKIVGALDAVLRRPEIDPGRVAMIGLSYGGYYTLYTTALEPRIRCAVCSCHFNFPTGLHEGDNPETWCPNSSAETS